MEKRKHPFQQKERLNGRSFITSARGFFHDYQGHQGQRSILKQRGKGKPSDQIVQQHGLSESKYIIISKQHLQLHTCGSSKTRTLNYQFPRCNQMQTTRYKS